jgi:enoyl-CoA hydratase/carnithine racemase
MLEIIDHGRIREIRLNRPPANAINNEMARSMGEALVGAAGNADAVIISGRPGMFSAGLDVPELLTLNRQEFGDYWRGFLNNLKNIALMPVPIVFALTGHAPAGGIVMALFGDYRIMPGGGFKTGLNEVQIGLVAPPEAIQALVRLIGPRHAERILVAGEMMASERALEIGLVDELVEDPATVIPRAIEWCEQHLALPGPAMLKTRALMRADLHAIFDGDNDAVVEEFVDLWFRDSTQRDLKKMVARLGKK